MRYGGPTASRRHIYVKVPCHKMTDPHCSLWFLGYFDVYIFVLFFSIPVRLGLNIYTIVIWRLIEINRYMLHYYTPQLAGGPIPLIKKWSPLHLILFRLRFNQPYLVYFFIISLVPLSAVISLFFLLTIMIIVYNYIRLRYWSHICLPLLWLTPYYNIHNFTFVSIHW